VSNRSAKAGRILPLSSLGLKKPPREWCRGTSQWDSLVRTPEINPLDTTITFTAPTKIKALRVRSTYSDFAIAVQVDGGERVVLDPIPEGDWATIVFPTPVTAKKILVQTLRKSRDNFVHVNDIELYQ
jgi:hypothetical protein